MLLDAQPLLHRDGLRFRIDASASVALIGVRGSVEDFVILVCEALGRSIVLAYLRLLDAEDVWILFINVGSAFFSQRPSPIDTTKVPETLIDDGFESRDVPGNDLDLTSEGKNVRSTKRDIQLEEMVRTTHGFFSGLEKSVSTGATAGSAESASTAFSIFCFFVCGLVTSSSTSTSFYQKRKEKKMQTQSTTTTKTPRHQRLSRSPRLSWPIPLTSPWPCSLLFLTF